MDNEKDFDVLYRGDVPQSHNFSARIVAQSRTITPKRDRTFIQNIILGLSNFMNHTSVYCGSVVSKTPSMAVIVIAVVAVTIGVTMDMGFDNGVQNQLTAFDTTDAILYDMMTL